MTDLDYLLRAVLAAPDDDLRRLVFADALEETGDSANVARAEFIRVQCELAKILQPGDVSPGCWCKRQSCRVCREINPLRFRSQDLLDLHSGEWIGPAADNTAQAWRGYAVCQIAPKGQQLRFAERLEVEFSRGFISRVRGPLAALQPALPAVVRGHPVEGGVEVTDREPMGASWFAAERFGLPGDRNALPDELFDLMPIITVEAGGYVWASDDEIRRHKTKDEAIAALSAALLAEARETAAATA